MAYNNKKYKICNRVYINKQRYIYLQTVRQCCHHRVITFAAAVADELQPEVVE